MALKEQHAGACITYTKSNKESTRANTVNVNLQTDPDFVGVYTKSDAGQTKFGGWSSEGLQRYKELVQWNREARQFGQTPELEQEILDKLRAENGIEGDTWEDQHKKTMSKNKDAPVQGEVADLFDMDD